MKVGFSDWTANKLTKNWHFVYLNKYFLGIEKYGFMHVVARGVQLMFPHFLNTYGEENVE